MRGVKGGVPIAAEVRFSAKVDKRPDGCWLWTGTKTKHDLLGYGVFWPGGDKGVPAHRFSYELHVGPIPDGYQIDHLCRVRACVNPDHLEPVTALENSQRGKKGILHTHCKQGHEMTEQNTLDRQTKRGRERKCRTCQNAANREYRAKLRERDAA